MDQDQSGNIFGDDDDMAFIDALCDDVLSSPDKPDVEKHKARRVKQVLAKRRAQATA
jgi:hypothetical protein